VPSGPRVIQFDAGDARLLDGCNNGMAQFRTIVKVRQDLVLDVSKSGSGKT
jgi:hypothetical protein